MAAMGDCMLMVSVVAALTSTFAAFALYSVMTSKALDEGLSPGVFVVLRDVFCACVLFVNMRARVTQKCMPDERDQGKLIVLGVLGLYMGQYIQVVGIQHSDAVLASYFANLNPLATYLMGLALRSEKCAANCETFLKISGLVVVLSGAIIATAFDRPTGEHKSLLVATVCFSLQIVCGNAFFWNLQKRLLETRQYSTHQMAAWYYGSGLMVLVLVVAPGATDASLWMFNKADVLALAVAVPVWPACAFLLTYANKHATPTTVTVFSPMQIVFTFIFSYVLNGTVPSVIAIGGAVLLVLGLLIFCLGKTFSEKSQSTATVCTDPLAEDFETRVS